MPPATALIAPFHEEVRHPGAAFISPQRLSQALDVSLTALSHTAALHRNSFRNPQSETVQRKLRDIARIVSRAEAMLGSRERAVYWFRNQPLADYAGRTAEDLVADGQAAAVNAYLDDVETGATG
jgi:hypothetical protein